MPCSRPDSPRRLTKHFLRQVEARHIRTPTSSPQILQWDPETKGLNEWYWPYDDATEAKLAPSLLQDHCRTHISGRHVVSAPTLKEAGTRSLALATPLPKERLLLISEVEDTFRDGDGLFQIMPSLIIVALSGTCFSESPSLPSTLAILAISVEDISTPPIVQEALCEAEESPWDGDTEIASVGRRRRSRC
ncbi:hypothetical protein DFP72DRAFT_841976 [Ephemerocybe angulata]|uniref:Uncharacterized protein n=1 Tax=Ephemerocybe angulata TaxID=980116 RepID=A0A8H6IEK0_9AGAR|nr:hypothetical protein DFP72DRAFT_841976 [Tulosesus angulatus]